MRRIPIRNAQIHGTYLTPRGMKIEVLRHRDDDEGVVVRSITSGGHEVVLPGGVMVTGDDLLIEDIKEDQVEESVENTLPNLIYHIIISSNLSTDEIADVTGFEKVAVEKELEVMVQSAIGKTVTEVVDN